MADERIIAIDDIVPAAQRNPMRTGKLNRLFSRDRQNAGMSSSHLMGALATPVRPQPARLPGSSAATSRAAPATMPEASPPRPDPTSRRGQLLDISA